LDGVRGNFLFSAETLSLSSLLPFLSSKQLQREKGEGREEEEEDETR
jgi:hypothetical protein